MRKLISVITLASALGIIAGAAHAQTAPPAPFSVPGSTFFGFGASYNPGASPSIAGTFLAAKQATSIGNQPTYAFVVIDALPASYKPFVVTTNVAIGVAQQIFTGGNVHFFVPLDAGFSTNGTNSGWNWSSGLLADIPVKGRFSVAPNFRTVKSSVNGNSGYQLIFGTLFCFGN